jgi:hypothetical protein
LCFADIELFFFIKENIEEETECQKGKRETTHENYDSPYVFFGCCGFGGSGIFSISGEP